MMSPIPNSLAALRAQADDEAPSVPIPLGDGTEITLRPLARLDHTTRDTLQVQLQDLDRVVRSDPKGRNAQVVSRRAYLGEAILRQLTANADDAEKLINELNGDAVLIGKVIDMWRRPAEPSP